MKEKDLRISLLLDFYGELLTERQRDTIEMYYNEDMSLAEISEHTGTTRQGVRDAVKRAEAVLLEMEEKLHLAERFGNTILKISEISVLAAEIKDENRKRSGSQIVEAKADRIITIASEL